jgi:putative resolvase
MNYSKKGLRWLISLILEGGISRPVIAHKDCLLRFGAEFVFSICESKSVEVIIINKGDPCSYEEDLAQDIFEVITVCVARLYGRRSYHMKSIESVR